MSMCSFTKHRITLWSIINTGTTNTSTTIKTTTSTTITTPPTTTNTTCASEFPFAYLNGDYCCKTNQELWYGGNTLEVASGSCDGKGFSIESTCCQGHNYQKCPHSAGCYDFIQTTPVTTTATTPTTSEEPTDVYSKLVEMAYVTLEGRKLTKGK